MKTSTFRFLALAAAFAAFSARAGAAPEAPEAPGALAGADALVASLEAALPPPPASEAGDPRDLIDEITALRNDGAARRDPDLRASRWLELAARAESIGLTDPLDPSPEGRWTRARALPAVVRHLVAALPPPSRWPAMREALEARAAAADPTNPPPVLSAMRLCLARLSGDKAAASKALGALQKAPGAAKGAEAKALRKAVFGPERPRRPGERRRGFGRLVLRGGDRELSPAEAFALRVESCEEDGDDMEVADEDLELPDETLAKLAASPAVPWMEGSDAARARFRAIVRAAGTNAAATAVAWSFADPTPDGQAYFAERAAVRGAPGVWEDELTRLAARGADILLSESWVSFFRFGGLGGAGPLASEAGAYLRAAAMLCGRDLAAGRIAEAEARLDAALPEAIRPAVALAAVALALYGDDWSEAFGREAEPSAALADFVERRAFPPAASATEKAVLLLLRAIPRADDASAARLGALSGRLKAAGAEPEALDALEQGRLAAVLAAALADDRFEEATEAARQLANRPRAKRAASDGDERGDKTPGILLAFARAMLAAGETNRFDEALALYRSAAARGAEDADDRSFDRSGEAALLAKAGQAAEAEAVYTENLLQSVDKLRKTGRIAMLESSGWMVTGDLTALAELYLDVGRPADALALFERVPLWGVADAAGLSGGCGEDPLRSLARALDGTGRTEDAIRVARHAVEVSNGGFRRDWPWELLLERLPAEEFLALADRMHALVPWEERPVQWKAEALRRAGRLVEAEESGRLALKIDPTDGESPEGERIRSYSILASILEEKGGKEAVKEAATLRSVVEAVRLAEEGDELGQAGLVSRALDAYDRAAGLFEAAYCVQWRLAERLRARGEPELAARHYEETFRRMPEQFGRVASLCFGCAGVFESGASVSAAERILPELAARPDALPATHRLLGMLRVEQKRYSEAWDAFRAALEADPGYLDALADLLALRGKIERPDADWEELQRRAFELDPLGLRLRIDAGDILDWTFAREANAAARARLPDAIDPVFPLRATAAALAATPLPRRSAWSYSSVFWGPMRTLADRAFDAAAAFAADEDEATWLGALCKWLEVSGGG